MIDKNSFKSLGLGKETQYPTVPSVTILETFAVPADKYFDVTFQQAHNEFTSLCPITGQPDFATFKIRYIPDKVCIETKSLKLYLFSYRNTQGFGETVTNKIADDLQSVLNAKLLLVEGTFSARGGITWTTKAVRLSGNDISNNLAFYFNL